MVDDDTRMIWGGVPGCFCPLHLEAFAKRTGRVWTREEVAKMLASSDARMSAEWEAVKVDSLKRFFQTIRGNFSPEVPGMLCVVTDACHLRHAREFAQILAAPGQTPVIRGGGAPYHNYGKDLFHVVDMRAAYARQMEIVGGDVVYMQESDTCPHTLWATSAVRMYDHLVMLALDGCKGAKMWITRTGNYNEKRSAEAYRRIMREYKGLMEWVAKMDFAQRGVVVPVCGPIKQNFGDRYLALVGIPYRFGKARPGEVTALTASTLAACEEWICRRHRGGGEAVEPGHGPDTRIRGWLPPSRDREGCSLRPLRPRAGRQGADAPPESSAHGRRGGVHRAWQHALLQCARRQSASHGAAPAAADAGLLRCASLLRTLQGRDREVAGAARGRYPGGRALSWGGSDDLRSRDDGGWGESVRPQHARP